VNALSPARNIENKRTHNQVKTSHKLSKLVFKLYCLLASDAGQDLVEYSLVVALIAFGATATMKKLAEGIRAAFTNASAALGSNIT